jgi:hypothetical protein
MLGASAANFVALASCLSGFVRPCLIIYLSEQKLAEIDAILVAVLQRIQYVSMPADRRVFCVLYCGGKRAFKVVVRAEKLYVCLICFLNKVMFNNSAFKS